MEFISLLSSSADNIAAEFLLDDVAGASIPASRLFGILQRVVAQRPLTVLQQEYLRQSGHYALLGFALGEIDWKTFRANAQAEQEARLAAAALVKAKDDAEKRQRQLASERHNAVLFEKQEKKLAVRAFLRRFGQPYIEREHYKRVMRILHWVDGGETIQKDDLVWLGSKGSEYWTPELSWAHHENFAKNLTDEWHRTGDARQAINACGHWRKANLPGQGLAIAEEALGQASAPTTRSALLTTGGGALRDLGRHDDAVQFANEAHALNPEDYRPCTLLGAVHIEMRAYAEGAEWYEKAEARGAPQNSIDRELQSILRAAQPEERRRISSALKAHDASRYCWL